ncbi:MAG TPA: Hpt domain-containing protein [Candidatus Binatia bacterium]|nr:Hpt domain-containing protein [Candidatus Binatia bacterium]
MPCAQPEPVISDPALNAGSLLELFRGDAEQQVRTLDGGLRVLLRDPSSAAALDTCLCAAGSLKDAARMAGHRAAAGLAGALEDCLVSAQRGRIVLRRESVELLLGGASLLARAAANPEVNVVRWTGELRQQVEEFLGGVKRLRDGRDDARATAPPAAAAAPAVQAPPVEPATPAPTPTAADAPDSGQSLLEPFRREARSQAQQLLAGMQQLEQDAAAQDTLETCRRAAHSLMGASRSVGLSAGLLLGHALESSFAAAVQGRVVLHPEALAVLRRGLELFSRIAASPPAEFGAWVRERRPELKAALTELESVRHAPGAAAAASLPPLEDIDSVTLLDLFHDEAQNLSQTLTAGLLALAREPNSPEQLESCMRAAHSFKGAARIVGLTMAVSLSRALEDTFTSAQRGEIHLGQEAVDLLLRGAELLAMITRAQDTGFGQWGSGKRAEVEVFLAALKHLRETPTAPPAETAPAPAPLPAPSAEPAAETSTAAGLAHDDRMTLFGLFHDEAEHLAQALTAGLLVLEHAPADAPALETCVHAAGSIRDAMRMVGRTMGASLARALEEYLAAAQHGSAPLRQGSVDLLLRGTELIAVIARAPEAQFGQWGSEKRAEVEVFLAALRRLRDEPAAAPALEIQADGSLPSATT